MGYGLSLITKYSALTSFPRPLRPVCYDLFMSNSKEQVYFNICNAVLKLEVAKGHLKWTVSDASRHSDVTRSLIYYYFGKDKETIVEEAYRYMLELIFNTERKVSLGLKDRLKEVLKKLEVMPYIFVLLYLQKGKETKIGTMIRAAEATLLKNFKEDFPSLSEDEIFKIYLLELGCVAYGLEPDQVGKVFSQIPS
jgi:hypothetical protein